MIIGLTGGIASGKSTASGILESFGGKIIDVDMIARNLVLPGTRALLEIEDHFGKSVILDNGELNRKLLGSIVFNDIEELERLNEITHKEIKAKTGEMIEKLVNTGERVIIVDAALFFEIGLNDFTESVWYVFSGEAIRMSRLIERNGFSAEEALARIKTQSEDLKNLADEIITNEGSLAELEESLRSLWTEYIGEKI